MRFVVFIQVLVLVSLLSYQASALDIKSYDISLDKTADVYRVNEQISVERGNDTVVLIWIQGEAKDLDVRIDNSKANFSKSENIYRINLTDMSELKITISYTLPRYAGMFRKYIYYRCKVFSAKLDGSIIYQGTNLSEGNYLSFSIEERVVERENLYMYTSLILLLALIVVLLYSVRSRGRFEKKDIESPEVLKVKKDLLMNVLKDIEKRYRSKELSEDAYNILKEDFKRETVNIVRRLEETEKD